MIQVKLMGEMGELFGTDWVCAENNMRDIIRNIEAQADGFHEYIQDMVEKGDVGIQLIHGEELLVKDPEEDAADLFLPIIKDTVYITAVPEGSGFFSDAFKFIAGVFLIIFAPQIIGFLAQVEMTWATIIAAETLTGAMYAALALASIGGLLALKGLTDYLTPQTPGESPDSYLFGNAQENVKMGSPVPLLYGELIVPGVTINYTMRDVRVNHEVSGFTYLNSSSSAANSDGDQESKSHLDKQTIEP